MARRGELSSAIEGASAEELAAVQKLQTIVDRRQALEAKVTDLDTQIVTTTQELQAAKDAIAAFKGPFEASTVALYQGAGFGTTNSFRLLSVPGSAHRLMAGTHYLDAIAQRFADDARRRHALKNQLADNRRHLTVLKKDVGKQRQQLAAVEQREQGQVDSISARKADFEAQYMALQAQIAAQLSHGNPTPGNHRFIWPVDGPIVSGFGPRVHPIYRTVRIHTGVDIAAPQGTPIKAAGDGVVTMAETNGGYGKLTVIDHGDGTATAYAHQSQIGVSVGQHVSLGQEIGNVGSTGESTGPHLHWEVRVNGNPVDPMGWV